MQNGKEKIKLPLSAGSIIVLIENPKAFTKTKNTKTQPPKLISEFTKSQDTR